MPSGNTFPHPQDKRKILGDTIIPLHLGRLSEHLSLLGAGELRQALHSLLPLFQLAQETCGFVKINEADLMPSLFRCLAAAQTPCK